MAKHDVLLLATPYVEYRQVSDEDLLRATIMNKSVVTSAGCWEWSGANCRGYGMIMRNRKMIRVHRLSYELWRGPFAEGLVMRHRCDNPKCVNPAHLEPGTQADNIRDISIRGRHGRKKLTKDQVAVIRASTEPTSVLADRFNVGVIAIRRARVGVTWKHVPNGPQAQGV